MNATILPPPLPDSPFSNSYAEARDKFLAAAQGRGAVLDSHVHPLTGFHGESLAMDVACLGDASSPKALLLSSACHGIEGYCGSGVQLALLNDAERCRRYAASGVAIFLVHAINPHGFSFGRRVTEDNVDLNRNTQDFSAPLPENPGYEELAALLVPDTWPPSAANEAAIADFIERRGLAAYQAAVSGGQYRHPEGLFFGGHAPTWSQRRMRQFLRVHREVWRHLGWIDFHTGLGPNGHGERICANRDDASALARTRAWWGEGVTSIYDGSSSSAPLTGLLWLTVQQECPDTQYTGMALEYGTEPVPAVIDALRASSWLGVHPDAPPALQASIRAQVRRAFYTETEAWREAIVRQGLAAIDEAICALQVA